MAIIIHESGSVELRTIDGICLGEIVAPEIDDRWPKWKGFQSCLFDDTQRLLWLVSYRSPTECEVQVVETSTLNVVAKTCLHDPYSGSAYSFHRTPRENVICLWMAAGQDGQQLFWLTMSDTTIEFAPGLENTSPPIFSPNGECFLVVDEHWRLCKHQFPTMQQIGVPLQSTDDEYPFDSSHCFLTNERAIAGSGNGRIFAVDTTKMEMTEELRIVGHEPRPTREYYPILVNDEALCTDISWFNRIGNRVFFVFRRSPWAEAIEWKDTLLAWQL